LDAARGLVGEVANVLSPIQRLLGPRNPEEQLLRVHGRDLELLNGPAPDRFNRRRWRELVVLINAVVSDIRLDATALVAVHMHDAAMAMMSGLVMVIHRFVIVIAVVNLNGFIQ